MRISYLILIIGGGIVTLLSAFLSQKVNNKFFKYLLWIIFICSIVLCIAASIIMEIDNNKTRESENKKIDRIIDIYNNYLGMLNTSRLSKPSQLIKRNEGKSVIKKSHPENEELKNRANQLSKEILEFIAVRQQYSPPIPKNKEDWDREFDKIVAYFKETNSQFELRFHTRITAMGNELAAKGLRDNNLNSVFDSQNNAISIRIIAERIKALAEQLP